MSGGRDFQKVWSRAAEGSEVGGGEGLTVAGVPPLCVGGSSSVKNFSFTDVFRF